jgi:putative sterol carrier protein
MAFFANIEEVDKYIGGIFRRAADDEKVGPKMKAAGITMRVVYTDPACEVTVRFHDPMTTTAGPVDDDPDVTLFMKADTADRFWRGKYNLAVGLARGEVKSKGPVNKILKLVPLTKPLFPMYRDLVAEKDAENDAAVV